MFFLIRLALIMGLFMGSFAICLAQVDPETLPKNEASIPVAVEDNGATSTGYTRPDSKARFKRYLNGMFGPMALGRSIAGAGISTWRNSPEEWGPHWEGFGRRFASNVGKNAIKQTITFGLDESLKLDSHFYRSKSKSTSARITNALISPFTARTASGKRVFGFPRIVGTYTANIIATETWYPDRYSYKDGLKNGTISLGFNAAFNLVKEFILHKR